jgi:AAA15 family ATPase/GTPase
MIQNLTIKNFKTHKSIEMRELTNVNILLGKNNSGKTAVLEALFFLSIPFNPRGVLIRLNDLRGYGTGEDSGEVWDSLFYNWDCSQEICIEAKEIPDESKLIPTIDGTIQRTLSIRPKIGDKRLALSTDISVVESSDLAKTTIGLSFEFKLSDEEAIRREVIEPLSQIISYPTDDMKKGLTAVFVPARSISDYQNESIRFSQLEVANRHNEIVDVLKILDPNLRRLFVVATKKGSLIYGDIGIDRPMPLPLMGDGMLHVLSIALAMVNSQNDLVLIDEIENGLHYSVLTDVWRMIFQTSLKLNTQVFVVTHSDECVKAAYEAVESLECYDSLKLYRFDRIKDGTRVEDYTANELYSAITSNQEVR